MLLLDQVLKLGQVLKHQLSRILEPGRIQLPSVTILVGLPVAIEVLLSLDGNGAATLPVQIPNDQRLAGIPLYLQSFRLDNSGFVASNGLEIIAVR